MAKKKINSYILSEEPGLSEVSSRYDLRGQVYHKEMPDVVVKIKDESSIQAQILDLSPNGIGIFHPSLNEKMLDREVEIIFGERKTYALKGIVKSYDTLSVRGGNLQRLGIVFSSKKNDPVNRPKRFKCSRKFQVVAYGEHPFRYNHTLLFNVADFSSNGMTLVGDIKENLLLPGATLLLNVMLPAVGEYEVLVEVTNIRSLNASEGINQFVIGTAFIKPSPDFLKAISTYLVLDLAGSANLKELKENGFLVPSMSNATVFSYVSTEHEWHQVLKLRLRAAQKEGRWLGETNYLKLSDEYDKYSRHIICKVENKIVASIRLVFNNNEIDRVEHKKFFEVPDKFWKNGFVEASRLCTDPDYRGSTLFLGFLQHVGRIVGQQGIRYVLMNCEDSLVPIYQRYGAKPLGVTFHTEFMQHKRLNMIYYDSIRVFLGQNMKISSWYVMWKDIFYFLKNNGFVKVNFLTSCKMTLLKLAGDVLFGIYDKKISRHSMKQRKHVIESFKEKASA